MSERRANVPARGTRNVFVRGIRWAMISLPLHLGWEIGHLRFYTLWQEASAGVLVYSLAHCTVGDAFIALGSFTLAGVVARDAAWPYRNQGLALVALLVSGLAYAAASEWINVHWLGRWAYNERMPLVYGIGITPLAQWLVVPLATLFAYRRLYANGRRADESNAE